MTLLLGIRLVLFAICMLAIMGVWYGERMHDIYFFSRLFSLFVVALPLAFQPQRVLQVWHQEPKTTSVLLVFVSVVAVFTLLIFLFPDRLVQFLRFALGIHARKSLP
jgi:hypothetical protein